LPVDDRDAFASLLGFFQMMRGEHDRDAIGLQRRQHFVDALAALRIDSDGRLVEQDQPGLVQEAAGDIQPALHASGEPSNGLIGSILESRPRQRPLHAVGQHTARHAVEAAEDLQVLFAV
jgi:hypothetical protein